MENVNYSQLCTIMLSFSFEYGVVSSPLDDTLYTYSPTDERLRSMVYFVVVVVARPMR